MRIKTTALTAIALALSVPLVGAPAMAQAAPAATTAEVDQNSALKAFFDEQDKERLARSPLGKSYRGIKDADYGRWDDYSEAAEARDHDAVQAALKELRTRFDPDKLSPENRLSYRLFEKQAERSIAAFQFSHNDYVFDQMNGAQSQIPAFLINIHRI